MTDLLRELSEIGVSIWLDDLSRTRIRSGGLAKIVEEDSVVGVTTNPAIFSAAIGDGATYSEQLAELATAGATPDEAVVAMTSDDVRDACDIMRPLYDSTGGYDGRVSIEVDPRISADAAQTVEQAKALYALVDRPNVLIKIPATPGSIPAIRETIAAGISVNVTLIFTVEQYREVLEAYMAGLEDAKAAGKDLSQIHSVASVFVSRIDTLLDPRLEEIGTDAALALRGQVALANTRLGWEMFNEVVAGQRWQALEAAGANRQRPLWASTGVKNPDYSQTMYVDQLAAPGTVNTMPEATLRACAAGAVLVGDACTPNVGKAHEVFAELEKVGIDFTAVGKELMDDGVGKFEVAWNALLESMSAALAAAK